MFVYETSAHACIYLLVRFTGVGGRAQMETSGGQLRRITLWCLAQVHMLSCTSDQEAEWGHDLLYFKRRERRGTDAKGFDAIHLQLRVELLGLQLFWCLDTQVVWCPLACPRVRGWLGGRFYILYKGHFLASLIFSSLFSKVFFFSTLLSIARNGYI